MLRIRPRQLVAFMQPFVAWASDYLAHHEPRLVLGCDREEITRRVRLGCELAVEVGISDPTAMLQLVVLHAELGPSLSRDPQVRAILTGAGNDRLRVDALLMESNALARLRERPASERWNETRHDVPADD